MVDLLRAVLLAAHLLCGAAACGAPAAAAWFAVRRPLRERFPRVAGRLVRGGSLAMLAGAVLGAVSGALLLASGDRAYLGALARVPSRDWGFLVAEWFFTLLLYAAAGWLLRGARRPWLAAALLLTAVTNLAYHFPTMMSVIAAEAADAADSADRPLDRALFRERMTEPVMIGRTLHFWALSLTAAGVATALATSAARPKDLAPSPTAPARRTATTVLIGLVLQAATGAATLFLLASGQRRAITGGDSLATATLLLAIGATLTAAHAVLPAATGRSGRLAAPRLLIAIAIATASMAWGTARARDHAAAAHEKPGPRQTPAGLTGPVGRPEG